MTDTPILPEPPAPVVASARWTASGEIRAVIDGVARTVPDDPGNAERRLIAAWGGAIDAA